MDEVIQAFRRAIDERGLLPRTLEADGRIHRCGTVKKPRSRNGVYCLHLDGAVPAGWFQNHEDGMGVTKWRAERLTTMSEVERQEWQQQVKAAREARDKQQRDLRIDTARRAQRIWEMASEPSADHPYLKRKGIKAHGARLHRGLIVLPMMNAVGGIVSLQFIAPDGGKKFLKDGEKRGCFFAIGEPDNEPDGLCIGEGFATMASVHEATGYMCVVAFDCGNLLPVAEVWRKKLPRARIVICADEDKAGMMAAREVVRSVSNCGMAWPDFSGGRAA